MQKVSETKQDWIWHMIGPVFVLCTSLLAMQHKMLICTSVVGLVFIYSFQRKGLYVSLGSLALTLCIEHLFNATQHLWLFGLEASCAIGLFVTSLSVELQAQWIKSLFSQLDAKTASVSNLEEELVLMQQATTSRQIQLEEKVSGLQKSLGELEAEHSSILILNEVLRKATAKESLEKEGLKYALQKAESSLETIQQQNDPIKSTQEESASLLLTTLEEEFVCMQTEKETVQKQYEQEQRRVETLLNQLTELEEEKHSVDHQLSVLQEDLERAQAQDHAFAEMELTLQRAEEKAGSLKEKVHQVENLHKQLRVQFDDKTELLHETRKELFRVTNELETLKLDMKSQELVAQPIPKELLNELDHFEQTVLELSEENRELEEIISSLSQQPLPTRKKKTKIYQEQTSFLQMH